MADTLNVTLAPQFVVNITHEMGGSGESGFSVVAGISTSSGAQTGAEIKVLYELEPDTNAYNDAAVAKLAAIEASATADQTGAEIKVAYELEADTNAYNDAAVAKLAGIETAATADQTGAQI